MSPLSADQFLTLVERSKLVEKDRLAQTAADWRDLAAPRALDDAQACADHLVDAGLLTHWQCKKLLEGRHRGFFLGKYKLLDHLGSGGMSSVYLAEHVLMQRRVAIKVLPQHRVNDSSYLQRFHLEAQAAAALDHRNIVRAYDLDNEGKIHYLVMEYIEGHDLHALVCQDGPLDYHTAANYIAQAAAGLDHAHHCGLVHRDIKPANLLVDLKGTVKILDMGLAKFMAETRPSPGFSQEEHVLGTADYLAPEQAVNSQAVDHRADIYALGCTLYFLLSGHPPFAVGTSSERMIAHQQQVPPSLLLDRPDAPPPLVAICRRMMEKSPLNRFQSASEVQQSLSAWLTSEAAAGRVSPAALTAASRGARRPPSHRNQAPSKTNLVSGSAADLHGFSAETPELSSSMQDTDSNLKPATVKIPPQLTGTPSDSSRALAPGSEVLSGGVSPPPSSAGSGHARPAAPPIMAPPASAPNVARDSQSRPLAPPVGASTGDASPGDAALPPSAHRVWLRRRFQPSESSSQLWIFVFSALVLLALLLAFITLTN